MSSINVICINTVEKVVSQTALAMPATATVADLKAAMGKSVQVLVAGAMPSDATLVRDLAAAYGSNNELRVNYSTEGRFGGVCVGTPIGCGAGW